MESQGLLPLRNATTMGNSELVETERETEAQVDVHPLVDDPPEVSKSVVEPFAQVDVGNDGAYTAKHSLEPAGVIRYASDSNFVMSDNSPRARLRRALSTHRFQVVIVSFVIIDCMIVIAELLMDLRLLTLEESLPSANVRGGGLSNLSRKPPPESHYLIPDVLHSINIAILSLFLLESIVKIVAFGLAFLRLGWEIFDTVVIVVTFVLDVLMQHSHSSTNGLGLLIILRLWRVARILNGMVRSVKLQADRHMECEKRRRQNLEEELFKYRETCERQKNIIIQMETLLQSHNIPLPHLSLH